MENSIVKSPVPMAGTLLLLTLTTPVTLQYMDAVPNLDKVVEILGCPIVPAQEMLDVLE
jgi:hypothetical protein